VERNYEERVSAFSWVSLKKIDEHDDQVEQQVGVDLASQNQ